MTSYRKYVISALKLLLRFVTPSYWTYLTSGREIKQSNHKWLFPARHDRISISLFLNTHILQLNCTKNSEPVKKGSNKTKTHTHSSWSITNRFPTSNIVHERYKEFARTRSNRRRLRFRSFVRDAHRARLSFKGSPWSYKPGASNVFFSSLSFAGELARASSACLGSYVYNIRTIHVALWRLGIYQDGETG